MNDCLLSTEIIESYIKKLKESYGFNKYQRAEHFHQ